MNKCLVCGNDFINVGRHAISHNMTCKEYYDKYLKSSDLEGICIQCGKPTKFRNLSKKYDSLY